MSLIQACLAFLLLLITSFSSSPALADWNTDFSLPFCGITPNPTGSATIGSQVTINFITSGGGTITQFKIGSDNIPVSPTATSYSWNTNGKSAGTYTFSLTTKNNTNGNTQTCTKSYSLYAPIPTPTPTPLPPNNSWIGGAICYMSWWEDYCKTTLYWMNSYQQLSNVYGWSYDFNTYYPLLTPTTWYGSTNVYVGLWGISAYLYKYDWSQYLAGVYIYGRREPMPAPTINYRVSCLSAPAYTRQVVDISWRNPPNSYPITWMDIIDAETFTKYYHKNVFTWANNPTTTAPKDFNGYSGTYEPLIIYPNKGYWVRLFHNYSMNPNEGDYSYYAYFSLPACPTPTPTPIPTPTPTPIPPTPTPTPTPAPPPAPVLNTSASSCGSAGTPGTSANLYWYASTGADNYKVQFGSNPVADVGNYTSYTVNNTAPGSTYTWNVRACKGASLCSNPSPSASISCFSYPAWLKTSGGNVHSNQ